MNKQQAIREVRQCADDIISQLERWDKGWDKGAYRDDSLAVDHCWQLPTKQAIRQTALYAFSLSSKFAN